MNKLLILCLGVFLSGFWTVDAAEQAKVGPGVATPDPQALFYPSLRAQVPNGVVGDPRAANAQRGDTYLCAWTELLVDFYRRAKNPK